jgi:hypothetical protein
MIKEIIKGIQSDNNNEFFFFFKIKLCIKWGKWIFDWTYYLKKCM